jgi:hypothetical protein
MNNDALYDRWIREEFDKWWNCEEGTTFLPPLTPKFKTCIRGHVMDEETCTGQVQCRYGCTSPDPFAS